MKTERVMMIIAVTAIVIMAVATVVAASQNGTSQKDIEVKFDIPADEGGFDYSQYAQLKEIVRLFNLYGGTIITSTGDHDSYAIGNFVLLKDDLILIMPSDGQSVHIYPIKDIRSIVVNSI